MKKNTLSLDEASVLIYIAAILFGAWFRFMPAWMSNFPINDGGMFYTMMRDLQSNNFIPPLYTTYNNLNIPFAYPPLPFYIGAFLNTTLKISLIDILRWLPALFNTLTIPAFFLLAKEITGNKFQSAIAALFFALTPHMNTWLSAGGGLTRSLGTVFMILTVYFSWKLFVNQETKSMYGIVLSGSLTILSHTESSIYAIALPALIWVVKSRSPQSAIKAGWAALGVLLLAGPWYGWVISQHGTAPLLSALQTGSQSIWSVLRLINVDLLTGEPYLDLLGVLGILGIIFLIAKKDYFLPLTLAAIYIIQPRSAHTIGNIPLALSSGIFFTDELLPSISKFPNGKKILAFLLTPYLLVNFIYFDVTLSSHKVSPDTRQAMEWVKQNTPPDATFLVLTGETDPMCDSIGEWFPSLAERTSIYTLQGREWLNGNDFMKLIAPRASIQACANKGEECLFSESKQSNSDFDYLYIAANVPTLECKPPNVLEANQSLILNLKDSTQFQSVFISPDAAIFVHK